MVSVFMGIVAALFVYLCKTVGWYDITWTNLAAVAFATLLGALVMVVIYKLFPRKEIDEIKNLISVWRKQ